MVINKGTKTDGHFPSQKQGEKRKTKQFQEKQRKYLLRKLKQPDQSSQPGFTFLDSAASKIKGHKCY